MMDYENALYLNEERAKEEGKIVELVNALIDSLQLIAVKTTEKIDLKASIFKIFIPKTGRTAWPLFSNQIGCREYCLALTCDGDIAVLSRTVYSNDVFGIYDYLRGAALPHVGIIQGPRILLDYSIELIPVHHQLLAIAEIFGVDEALISEWKLQYEEAQQLVDRFVSEF